MEHEIVAFQLLAKMLENRGRSAMPVAAALLADYVEYLVEGKQMPHITTRDQQALEKETGLPWKFWGFLIHSGDDRRLTLVEAEALAVALRQTDRRRHAANSPIDYSSMLEEIRPNATTDIDKNDSECEFCGESFTGQGGCPNCGLMN